MIESEPAIKDVLFSNLQLFNQGRKFESLVSDWVCVFRTCLNDLLRSKGIIRAVNAKEDIDTICALLDEGSEEHGREPDFSFFSLLGK